MQRKKLPSVLRAFLDSEASGGIVLMLAALAAILVANSPMAGRYEAVLHTYAGGLSVLHWINDGLMALFFLLVGLEIKREVLDGQLSSWPRRVLPGFAALGGMLVPALVYLACNRAPGGEPVGWAVPAATDIAFALGVLSLLGSRVPASLRIFLTALAIIDDLGAVLIIALFYSGALDWPMLGAAAAVLAALAALNRLRVTRLAPYLLLGALLWFLTLRSGLHATIAGVALALTIPLRPAPAAPDSPASPLHRLEHGLQPYVAFLVVPVFGFANAGVRFAGMSPSALLDPVPLGVALGLFLGKQAGVFLFAWGAIRAGWAERPLFADWGRIYAVSVLCGIGFTMSLFIGLLAFPASPALQEEVKLGVLVGSCLSALAGAGLFLLLPRRGPARLEARN